MGLCINKNIDRGDQSCFYSFTKIFSTHNFYAYFVYSNETKISCISEKLLYLLGLVAGF